MTWFVLQDLLALEEERKVLRANLDDSEARNTKLELLKRSLEGDIQRTKVLLTDKETEVQVMPFTCYANVGWKFVSELCWQC